MGVNKIAKMNLPFVLDYYLKTDHARFDKDTYQSQIEPHIGRSQMLLWDAFRDGDTTQDIAGMGDLPNTVWVTRCKKHHYYDVENDKAAQSWHFPEYCTAINSASLMAQWAVMLGYNEIFLVGFDGIYTNGKDDHFAGDYYTEVDSTYAERNNRNAAYAHKVIRRSCPVPVYNATAGGSVEVYPRVNLEDVCQ